MRSAKKIVLRTLAGMALAFLIKPMCAEDVRIPPNASPEVRKALEDHNRMRKTPFVEILNKAAEIERQDPAEAERLLKQALEMAPASEVPSATTMSHFQLALFYYRQRRLNEGDAELSHYQDWAIRNWSNESTLGLTKMASMSNKLTDVEAFGNVIKNSADLHQYGGRADVAERLLKKRLEFVNRIASKLRPEVDEGLFEDRLGRSAWQDLHTFYFNAGREADAAKIWKKYPSLEAEYKRMKEYALKTGRYPPFPSAP